MKLKSLAIMAVAVMFATPFAYAAPTTLAVDDMSSTNTPSSSDSNIGNIGNPNTGDNMPSTSGAQASNDQGPMPGAGAPNTSDTSNSNDDMSADTATGDDDY
jgi:hypothetical protein